MSSRSSRQSSEGVVRDDSSTSSVLSPLFSNIKPPLKHPDWSEVTNPEERRRIQNRIAQRKFREKARETKEKAERGASNQLHAGNSYRIPTGSDFPIGENLSGLPWGSINLGHIISRGREAEKQSTMGKHLDSIDSTINGRINETLHGGMDTHPASRSSSTIVGNRQADGTIYVYDPTSKTFVKR